MWKREIRRRDGGVLWDDGGGVRDGIRERCVVGNQSTETVG